MNNSPNLKILDILSKLDQSKLNQVNNVLNSLSKDELNKIMNLLNKNIKPNN